MKQYYCEMCDENHEGEPIETGPMFVIGCCWELEWEGTREQAGGLYDYLVGEGYLHTRTKCGAGCIDVDGDQLADAEVFWKCGECGASWATNEYGDAQQRAIDCCKEKLEAERSALEEEVGA